jgi:large repetitive protein
VGALGVDFPRLADIGSAYVYTCAGCPVITIGPATALPQGRVGTLYSQKFTASGGSAPYTFSVSLGALPPGLKLAPDGTLSGVATTADVYNFTVQAMAGNLGSGSRAYSITVSGACPTITVNPTNPTLPPGRINNPYMVTFTATGGTAPYTFSVVAGTLLTGLTLTPAGVLSGKSILGSILV